MVEQFLVFFASWYTHIRLTSFSELCVYLNLNLVVCLSFFSSVPVFSCFIACLRGVLQHCRCQQHCLGRVLFFVWLHLRFRPLCLCVSVCEACLVACLSALERVVVVEKCCYDKERERRVRSESECVFRGTLEKVGKGERVTVVSAADGVKKILFFLDVMVCLSSCAGKGRRRGGRDWRVLGGCVEGCEIEEETAAVVALKAIGWRWATARSVSCKACSLFPSRSSPNTSSSSVFLFIFLACLSLYASQFLFFSCL
uniref:Uncharacterized protein TCIL3000_9_5940 n=1 Tax=Trypanosoma congolense (strain IL3000) TaxID=1068625 RepID=G0UUX2_TRYCI|nr:unnamed protein product [Trypanosoma congolense IL3000]